MRDAEPKAPTPRVHAFEHRLSNAVINLIVERNVAGESPTGRLVREMDKQQDLMVLVESGQDIALDVGVVL